MNNNIIAFWRISDPYGYLGQWYISEFKFDKKSLANLPDKITSLSIFKHKPDVIRKLMKYGVYSSAEKFMMMGKAALFYDNDIFDSMGKTNDPKNHKSLGRKIKNFNGNEWNNYRTDIVVLGNYLKFTQNEYLLQELIKTGDAILVEGSPIDKIWGVGLKFNNPKIYDEKNWKGLNLLGKCLEIVRDLVLV